MSLYFFFLTWSSTVSAGVIARHLAELTYDSPREFLKSAVLKVKLVSTQGCVQGLVLAVLQHGHPAKKHTYIKTAWLNIKRWSLLQKIRRNPPYVLNLCFFPLCLVSQLTLHLQNSGIFFFKLFPSLCPQTHTALHIKELLGGPHTGEGQEEKDIRLLPSIPTTHNRVLLLAVSG